MRAALLDTLKDGSVLTALIDTSLAAAREVVPHDVEVDLVPFGRLLGLVAGMCGDSGAQRMTQQQLTATITAVCSDLELQTGLSGCSNLTGMSVAVGEALTELHQHGVGPGELRVAAETAPEAMGFRLRDLAAIEDRVREVSAACNREFGVDRAQYCLNLPDRATIAVKHVVCLCAGDPKPLYEKWLVWLASNGVAVDVVLEEPKGSLFDTSRQTVERLMPSQAPPVPLPQWTDCLFANQTATDEPQVTVTKCPDQLAECEWAVRLCQSLLRDGAMESEVAIFVRLSESYLPLIVSAARRLGLRVRGAMTVPLLANGFAHLTLQVLKALVSKDVRAVARLARSSYLSDEQTDLAWLDAACSGAYLTQANQWESLAERSAEPEAPSWLQPLLEWRLRALDTPKRLNTWSELFREIWIGTDVLDRVAWGGPSTAERDLRAQTAMQTAIKDAFVPSVQPRQLTFASFVSEAERLWDREQVVWADRLQGVKICTATAQFNGFKHVIAIGMLEGVIPIRRKEHPVLDDEIRRHLGTSLSLATPLPDSHQIARRERDEFVRICGAGSQSLNLMFPGLVGDRDNVPAFYLQELERALGDRLEKKEHKKSELAPSVDEAYVPVDMAVRAALDGPKSPRNVPDLVTETARKVVRPSEETGISMRQVADAAVCPFRSAVRHVLRLRPPAGSVLRVLESVPSRIGLALLDDWDVAETALKQGSLGRISELAGELAPDEVKMLTDATDRVVESWVEIERLLRQAIGPKQFSTLTRAKLADVGLSGTLKGLPVTDILDVAYTNEDTLILVQYRKQAEGKDPADFDALVYFDLLARVAARSGKRLSVFAVPVEGKPLEVVFGGRPYLKTEISYRVNYASKDEVTVASKDGLNDVLDGAMLAKPGLQCEKCRLGPLCRSHNQHGEQAALQGGS